jgi:hypothetical protein
MKTAWFEGDPLEEWPEGVKKQRMRVEPAANGFWCYYGEHRSPGSFPETPFHETLIWLVQQISLGNFAIDQDEHGEELTVAIGKAVASPAASAKEAAERAGAQAIGLSIAGLVAGAREKGYSPNLRPFLNRAWEEKTESASRRMEMHYALEMARLLGRISKKLPKLEDLPLVERAPETVRAHIAEATRCYLLKLDRACIALCRACLEDTLRSILTPEMQQDWRRLMAENKRLSRNPNQMQALIEVCAKHGVLNKDLQRHAHDVREAGNRVLHLAQLRDEQEDLAGQILKKTRIILALIYGGHSPKL